MMAASQHTLTKIGVFWNPTAVLPDSSRSGLNLHTLVLNRLVEQLHAGT